MNGSSPTLLAVLVAVSGTSALVYEILWVRALGLHFGTTTPALATVTATFMAGMALGNRVLGARADRTQAPLRLYAAIELAIAVFGLVVSVVLLRADALLDRLSRAAQEAGAGAGAVRIVAVAALLLVPTTLMGGTVPVVARALLRGQGRGRVVSQLYACNTLGAVAGALLPDFWLVPQHGRMACVWLAASGNLLVAVSAALLSRGGATARATAEQPEAQARERGRVVALAAVSGLAGMALEVLWSRTLEHWSAGLVTSFAALLAVYLVMLALGAALAGRLVDAARAPLRVAVVALAACAVTVAASVALAPRWRDLERALLPRPDVPNVGLWGETVDVLLHATYLEAVPCLLMGMSFVYLARAAVDEGAVGRSTGLLFMSNTLGCVLGSAIAAFVWLPALGQQYAYLTVSLLLALSCSLAWSADSRGFAAAVTSTTLAVVLAVTFALPAEHLLRAHFRSGGILLAVREGAATTAAAARRFAFGEPLSMELLTPGVSMSDTGQGARRYMGVMAHAAMFAARQPRRALLVCYGVGNTARSLLSHAPLQRLDVVDISREVLDLAPLFARVQGSDPLADPRTRVFVDDGRHHLIVRGEPYDVITAEPPPPNHAGVVNLYARELYRLARARLRPGGVITQWLPVFQLSRRDTLTMISAFVAELPHAVLLYGYDGHLVLVGSPSPLRIDPAQELRLRVEPGLAADLQRSGIRDLAALYGAVLQTDAELRALVAAVPPLRDDRPSIQYPFERVERIPEYAALFGDEPARATALLPPGIDPAFVTRAQDARRAIAHILPLLSRPRGDDDAEDELVRGARVARALALQPRDEGLLSLLGLDADRARAARAALARPFAAALLRSGAPRPGSDPRALAALTAATLTLARRDFYLGDHAHALERLSQLPARERTQARVELLTATALGALGDTTRSEQHLARALSRSPALAASFAAAGASARPATTPVRWP